MITPGRRFVRRVNQFDPPKFPPVNKQKYEDKVDEGFHFAITPIATFVQFLALMPVSGISLNNPKHLSFQWKSFRVCYTLAHITYGVFISYFFFTFLLEIGISAKNVGERFFNKILRQFDNKLILISQLASFSSRIQQHARL